ncbi:DUF4189 domain-containing protein [Lysobacter sp. 5GHs7-4]|uniref:DUF4189 domain-containing protein n=1 Tax=Lysobacter sp. 5GHs7-4 TaxID=2904253 RepID=UPI001E2B127D|nr:DUF4189 domain-containing protein [Lysobacter sp. 5GHs7-4]UHQ23838.1 DUF4189 domain-containing protein [Lysobacter sp. 5GHs7-4]
MSNPRALASGKAKLSKCAWATVLMAALAANAKAEQGCPDNFVPNPNWTQGQSQCIPGPPTQGDADSSPPAPVWATRWGAIAIDSATGNMGAVTDMPSKRKAVDAALARCRDHGGTNCKISLEYHNQCAASAWGEGNGGTFVSFRAPSEKDAVSGALNQCGQDSGGACETFYSGCSSAQRVR